MERKTYYVLWTYMANYSGLIEVKASSAEDACKEACSLYGAAFREKATIYAFDSPPAFVNDKGSSVTRGSDGFLRYDDGTVAWRV